MTVEQLVIAKELDAEIKRVNGVVTDLESITSDLRVYEHDKGCKFTIIRIDVGYGYKQTPPINLNKEFVDVLVDEDTVNERFYINSPRARELVQKLVDNGELVTEQRERESNCRFISQQSKTKENCKLHNRTSCTRWELDRKAKSQKQWSRQFCKKKRDIHFVGNISPINKRQNPNQGRVYMVDGISPTLTGMEGGGRQPHIIVRSAI